MIQNKAQSVSDKDNRRSHFTCTIVLFRIYNKVLRLLQYISIIYEAVRGLLYAGNVKLKTVHTQTRKVQTNVIRRTKLSPSSWINTTDLHWSTKYLQVHVTGGCTLFQNTYTWSPNLTFRYVVLIVNNHSNLQRTNFK